MDNNTILNITIDSNSNIKQTFEMNNQEQTNNLDPLQPSLNLVRLNSIDSFKIINPNLDAEKEFNSNITGDYTTNEQDGLSVPEIERINLEIDPTQLYKLILDEIYDVISDNKELFENKNINISKPDIKYENRKTFWFNFGKNCSQINRTTTQVKKFIESELSVETSINQKQQLILKNKYNFNMISSSYKKYIKNFVQCQTCKSIGTEIVRNQSNRLDYLKCLNPKCNSYKVVSKI